MKKAQVFTLARLIELIFGILAVIMIFSSMVYLANILFNKGSMKEYDVSLNMVVGEINDLNPGESIGIALIGNPDNAVAAYSGEAAKSACPGKSRYCACIIREKDNLCRLLDPKSNDVKLTTENGKVMFSKGTLTLKYIGKEIILS